MPRSVHRVRLDWPGREETKAVKAAELTSVCEGSDRAELVHGDNLLGLSALTQRRKKASLIYFDPPFFTGREHAQVERKRGKDGVIRKLVPAFDDRWESLQAYLSELGARLTLARELLDSAGCLVLHVDPKTSHYAKVLCDEIFGHRSFASEIIWRYRRWPAKTPNFQRVHDVLLRYVKDPDVTPTFNQLYEPLAASTEKTWGRSRQRAVVDAGGRRRRSSTTEELSPGAPLGDVWEISIVAPVARERTGYPTQKPEALLERLVLACTAPDDWVVDAYAGSGTTLAVSARLGRRCTGLDLNADALAIAKTRLMAHGVTPSESRVSEARARTLTGRARVA